MAKLFGIPMGVLAVVLVAVLVARARRWPSSRCETASSCGSACGTSAAAGPQRADRRRADARHGDHRRRPGDRRHDVADDPFLGGVVARPDRRARVRAGCDADGRGAERCCDGRAVLPAGRLRRRPARGGRLAARRRRRPGDHRDRRRAGSGQPPDGAPGGALCERGIRAARVRRDHAHRRPRGFAVGAGSGLGVPESHGRRQAECLAGRSAAPVRGSIHRRCARQGDRRLRRRRHRRLCRPDAALGGPAVPGTSPVGSSTCSSRTAVGRPRVWPPRIRSCDAPRRRSRRSGFRRTRPSRMRSRRPMRWAQPSSRCSRRSARSRSRPGSCSSS